MNNLNNAYERHYQKWLELNLEPMSEEKFYQLQTFLSTIDFIDTQDSIDEIEDDLLEDDKFILKIIDRIKDYLPRGPTGPRGRTGSTGSSGGGGGGISESAVRQMITESHDPLFLPSDEDGKWRIKTYDDTIYFEYRVDDTWIPQNGFSATNQNPDGILTEDAEWLMTEDGWLIMQE